MELRHLRYFVAVAEAGHFGRAAAALHVSTPTLSEQVRALEEEVGAPLLVRHPRGASPTAAGEALLVEARTVLLAADTALREARRAAGIDDGALRLGLLTGAPPWLPERLGAILERAAPGHRPAFVGGSTSYQLGLLERGELDLALTRDTPEDGGYEHLALVDEELGVVVPAGHPLAEQAEVACADLSGQELVWYPRHRAPRLFDEVMATIERLGGRPEISTSAMAVEAIRTALPLLDGAITLGSTRMHSEDGTLIWRPLVGRPLSITVWAVWRSRPRDPALRAFVKALRKAVARGPLAGEPS
ncbi:Hca operon transcriptional activator HcaR [Baekduia alba]|uniref:LysR family transcriptional regulator n=1 Tax=Baekduia alba TaxID=2997333 RepID=UPI00233FCE4F|nr:LysR substrate-binding domain-containing protein [Baekduia alba]WCB94722.1 Hca operon transcriptional activator HcaR [Baekduia alba]